MNLRLIREALEEQGFEIDWDETHEGRRWMLVFKDDVLVTVFVVDRPTLRSRMNSLRKVREAGFKWPE